MIGGRRRAVEIRLDRERLASHQVSPLQVHQALAGVNWRLPAGSFASADVETAVEVDSLFRTADEVAATVVGVSTAAGRSICATSPTVVDGAGEAAEYAWMVAGAAAAEKGLAAAPRRAGGDAGGGQEAGHQRRRAGDRARPAARRRCAAA